MTNLVTAETEHTFTSLSAEEVYDAWLDTAKVRQWMPLPVEKQTASYEVRSIKVDARVGERFYFADTRDGEDSEAFGTYLVLERPRRISFTWFVSEEEEADATSVVRIALEPHGEGCIARVEHDMDAEYEEYLEQTASAWHSMLAAMDEVFGSG